MRLSNTIERVFKHVLPSPFTIAVLLTLLTFVLACLLTDSPVGESHVLNVLGYWESGIWSKNLLVFAYQMMLILVVGHVLVLSKPASLLILMLTKQVKSTTSAVVLVSVCTMLVSFFNWGLGLVFGAILARKVGEYCQENSIPINYPLIGASGYVGLMVWHGGISGSAPIKVSEPGHLKSLVNTNLTSQLPETIATSDTIFSTSNLFIFLAILVVIPLVLSALSKKAPPSRMNLPAYQMQQKGEGVASGAEKLDNSRVLAYLFGFIIVGFYFYKYGTDLLKLKLGLNSLNFFMIGLAIILHGSFSSFLKAVDEAIKGTSGILIQFPLYFGIMGMMSNSGMVQQISDFFVTVSNAQTLPIFTFFSAGLVNIFVPSGGGQWAIQGPIIIESAMQLGVPLNKSIMALAYGDQITNMLQPFWALPLLGITKLKAKDILPYTLFLMLVGIIVYIVGLILF